MRGSIPPLIFWSPTSFESRSSPVGTAWSPDKTLELEAGDRTLDT